MNYVSVTFKIPISSLVSNELWGDVNWLCKWTTLKCKEAEFNVFGLLDKRSLPKSRRQNFGFWPMGGSLTLNLTFFLQNIRQLNTWFFWALPFVGKGKYTKSMIFWKNSKRPSTTPPPSFLENYIANFLWQMWLHIYARRYGGWIVWNACTWFPDIGVVKLLKKTYREPFLWPITISVFLFELQAKESKFPFFRIFLCHLQKNYCGLLLSQFWCHQPSK